MIELFHMDCMDYMREQPDKSFDLAICDPPYGIGNFSRSVSEERGKRDPKHPARNAHKIEWNDSIPKAEYFKEIKRVSENQIIWGANYYNCFEPNKGAIVWFKGDATKTISACEIASHTYTKKVDYVHINWQSGFYRELFGEQIHPCQKPVKLYEWLLRNYAEPGQRIIDTHLGSGSSAIAAHYFGVDFVGIEIDEDYYNAARERFDKETAQVALF